MEKTNPKLEVFVCSEGQLALVKTKEDTYYLLIIIGSRNVDGIKIVGPLTGTNGDKSIIIGSRDVDGAIKFSEDALSSIKVQYHGKTYSCTQFSPVITTTDDSIIIELENHLYEIYMDEKGEVKAKPVEKTLEQIP